MPYGYQIRSLIVRAANSLVLEYDLNSSEREAVLSRVTEGENHLTILFNIVGEEFIFTRDKSFIGEFLDKEFIFLSGMINKGGALTQREFISRGVFLRLIVKELENVLIIMIRDLQLLLAAGKVNNTEVVSMIYNTRD